MSGPGGPPGGGNTTSLARDDYWNSPDYAGTREVTTNAILLSISTLLVAARVYIRLFVKKSAGLDDAFCVAALVGFLLSLWGGGEEAAAVVVGLPTLTRAPRVVLSGSHVCRRHQEYGLSTRPSLSLSLGPLR
jgi:hypothetical protein